jgi:hypothetical protein
VNRRQEQQARNEALLREVNERIEHLNRAADEKSLTDYGTTFEFLCECGRANENEVACDGHVEMTLREYEEIRSQDDRFAVVPGHENHRLEKVVRRTDRYVVVDKRPAAEPFVEDDPRGAPSG